MKGEMEQNDNKINFCDCLLWILRVCGVKCKWLPGFLIVGEGGLLYIFFLSFYCLFLLCSRRMRFARPMSRYSVCCNGNHVDIYMRPVSLHPTSTWMI